MILLVLVCGVFLLAQLMVLGLSLKIYTEILKERAQQDRVGLR
jgi:hypothetical protein